MPYETTTFDPAMESETSRSRETLERAKVRTREAAEDTMDWVRRYPGRTLAISFGVGAALGALIVMRMAEREETRWEKLAALGRSYAPAGRKAWKQARSGLDTVWQSLRDAVESAVERYR